MGPNRCRGECKDPRDAFVRVVQLGNTNDLEMSRRSSVVDDGRPLGGKCQVNEPETTEG